MREKALTFKELKKAIGSVPSKSIRLRDMGGHKVELISVVKGHVTRLGYIQLYRNPEVV